MVGGQRRKGSSVGRGRAAARVRVGVGGVGGRGGSGAVEHFAGRDPVLGMFVSACICISSLRKTKSKRKANNRDIPEYPRSNSDVGPFGPPQQASDAR